MTASVEPIAELVDPIAESTRAAIQQFRATHRVDACLVALVTSGEGYRPYLALTEHGEGQWDLASSRFAIVEDEIMARTEPAFDTRGFLYEMDDDDIEVEFQRRLASMEAALRRLDDQGLFGVGEDRGRSLLLVATMPPSDSEAEIGRRLNPAGPLLSAWLAEAAEGP